MRAATALHTTRQHSRPGFLHVEMRAFGYVGREKRLAGSEDAPVRLLVCKERKVNVLSRYHEGGSCPAHRQATLKQSGELSKMSDERNDQ